MDRSSQQGFTLLELLLVLSVVFILTAFAVPVGQKWTQQKADEKGVQSIVATIHSVQSHALANGIWTSIKFTGQTYVIRAEGGKDIARGALPEGFRFAGNAQDEIIFLPNGNIVRPGTVVFASKSGGVSLKLQFVRGRVIVSE